jgi:hypothetical protein
MQRTPITSSNILSAGYDPATKMMEVEFRGKGGNTTYQYHEVPKEVYDGFLAADSKGSYLHSNIKRFKCSKV